MKLLSGTGVGLSDCVLRTHESESASAAPDAGAQTEVDNSPFIVIWHGALVRAGSSTRGELLERYDRGDCSADARQLAVSVRRGTRPW
jgi:hypothetical protein